MIAEDLNLCAAQTNKLLQEELKETLRASKSPFARISTSTSLDKLESTIKKEMDLFECREQGGDFGNANLFFCFLPDPPEITIRPRNLQVRAGGVAAFYCAARGDPMANIQWRKNGKRVSSK
ncbi:hypothetical protein ACJJTC_011829 [Scirpophaga incertulas]